jgi:hypothetical protein
MVPKVAHGTERVKGYWHISSASRLGVIVGWGREEGDRDGGQQDMGARETLEQVHDILFLIS